ncbi:MAG: class A beta-lactamase [Sphingomonadaceae bacterium]
MKSLAGFCGLLLLAACIPQASSRSVEAPPPPVRTADESRAVPPQPIATEVRRTPPAPRIVPAVETASRILDARLAQLARNFDGDVGIAVHDIQRDWTSHYQGHNFYPQQSVSKLWVALTAFDKADRGELDLRQRVTVRRDDLTLFHQPIRAAVLNGGFSSTLDDLVFRAITQSDNTANDFVLWRAGGPEAVRATLRRKGIQGIRFGPGERVMQSRIAGLEWNPSYSLGRNFYTARANVPASRRRSAFESYIADPVDGATPTAMVEALARLKRGELLSPAATSRMLGAMSSTRTGPRRLKGGLAPGWRLAHKTGTGQVYGSTQAGYNDVGILTAPDGRSYAVAVLIGRTSRPVPERMELMQQVSRAVIDYVENMKGR